MHIQHLDTTGVSPLLHLSDIPILQMRKLRLTEVKRFVQGHTAEDQQDQNGHQVGVSGARVVLLCLQQPRATALEAAQAVLGLTW